MKRQDITLDHPSQLNAISALPWRGLVHKGRVTLGGSISDHPKRGTWERDINSSYRACGCNESAIGMMAGLVGGALYGATQFMAGAGGWDWAIAIAAGAIAGAFAGKLAGKVRAESRLRKAVAAVQQEWKVEGSGKNDFCCG